MTRSPARQKKRTKAVASLSKRRKFLVSMVPCILFQECGRAVTAFSSFPRRPSYVRGRNFVANKMSTVTLQSARNDSESQDKNAGLILPSHPNFPIKSVMAPMVAASDYPFRYFLRKYCDVDLTFTQMLHSKKFVNDPKFRLSHLDLWEAGVVYPELLPSQLSCLGDLPLPLGPGKSDSGYPLVVQLAGNEPSAVVEQANLILDHTDGNVSGFDLNCGCPQNIAKKGNYGAFLMERDFDRVCDILRALRQSVPESTAVSAKIRLPTDDATLKERIPMLMGTGINFLTIHGRTLYENKTKVDSCHVDRIKLAIDTAHKLNPDFPVIANGGMESYEDIQEILKTTGAVAAMSSEALLEIPNIFSPSSSGLTPRERLTQQIAFANDYLDVCANIVPPLPGALGMNTEGSFKVIRGHLFKFLYRYLSEQTDLRDRLGDCAMQTIAQAREFVDELEGRYSKMSDDELMECKSTSPEASWYRRHRKPDRRVHQKEIPADSSLSPLVSKEESIESIESRKQQIRDRLKIMNKKKKESETAGTKRFIS
jgi:tRNA-dihydrouridine synthase